MVTSQFYFVVPLRVKLSKLPTALARAELSGKTERDVKEINSFLKTQASHHLKLMMSSGIIPRTCHVGDGINRYMITSASCCSAQ